MCFSATASFTAGAVLTVIGALTLGKVKAKKEYWLAAVPLVFAVQQMTEGALWLNLLQQGPMAARFVLTQIYVVFAGVVWPLVIPAGIF